MDMRRAIYTAGIFETFRLLAGIPKKSNLKKYTTIKVKVTEKNNETEDLVKLNLIK